MCVCVISVGRLQAVFTVLRSFGCVSSPHSDASSRFSMVLSLDFNHKGQAAAGHLQVPLQLGLYEALLFDILTDFQYLRNTQRSKTFLSQGCAVLVLVVQYPVWSVPSLNTL